MEIRWAVKSLVGDWSFRAYCFLQQVVYIHLCSMYGDVQVERVVRQELPVFQPGMSKGRSERIRQKSSTPEPNNLLNTEMGKSDTSREGEEEFF